MVTNMKKKQKQYTIIILDDALRIATEETVFWKHRHMEAGGSLVGIQDEHSSIILYAIPTGPNADQSAGHIATDVDYQNQCLKSIARYYRKFGISTVYLADWHLHPMYLPRPSSIDRASCVEILSDPIHNYLHGLPLILITFRNTDKVICVPLWITLRKGKLHIENATMEIVSSSDPRIVVLLKGVSYQPFEKILGSDQSVRKRQPRQQQVAAANLLTNRLQLEIADIKRCFGVLASVSRTHSGYMCLSIAVDGLYVVAVVPSEFPLNPPLVFMRNFNSKAFEEFGSQRVWNSCARISDILEEVLQRNNYQKSNTGNSAKVNKTREL